MAELAARVNVPEGAFRSHNRGTGRSAGQGAVSEGVGWRWCFGVPLSVERLISGRFLPLSPSGEELTSIGY